MQQSWLDNRYMYILQQYIINYMPCWLHAAPWKMSQWYMPRVYGAYALAMDINNEEKDVLKNL